MATEKEFLELLFLNREQMCCNNQSKLEWRDSLLSQNGAILYSAIVAIIKSCHPLRIPEVTKSTIMSSGMFLNLNRTIFVTSLSASKIYCSFLQQLLSIILTISLENFQILQKPQLLEHKCRCSTRSWTNARLYCQRCL